MSAKKTAKSTTPVASGDAVTVVSLAQFKKATKQVKRVRLTMRTAGGEPIDVLYTPASSRRVIALIRMQESLPESEMLEHVVGFLAEVLCDEAGNTYATPDIILDSIGIETVTDIFQGIVTGRQGDDGGTKGNV